MGCTACTVTNLKVQHKKGETNMLYGETTRARSTIRNSLACWDYKHFKDPHPVVLKCF